MTVGAHQPHLQFYWDCGLRCVGTKPYEANLTSRHSQTIDQPSLEASPALEARADLEFLSEQAIAFRSIEEQLALPVF